MAAGSTGMAQNFGSSSTQGSMLVSVGSNSENSTITLTDNSGKTLLSWVVEKSFSCVVISCPEIVEGETYTVSIGGTTEEVTMSSLIYGSEGMGGNPEGMGGNPGGMGGNPGDKGGKPGGMGGGKGTRP